MARWFGLTERASRFLSEREANQIYSEGMLYVKTHVELAAVSCRPYEQFKFMVSPGLVFFRYGKPKYSINGYLAGKWNSLGASSPRSTPSSTSFWRQSEQVAWNNYCFGWLLHFTQIQIELDSRGQNTRYHHCYTDEDSMRWVKGLARKANPAKLEMAVMKMNRTRFESMKARKGTDKAKKTARDRAARDNL